ncbi:PAS domain-containing protein [Flavobacterium sp.]|uniref:sensor histidine kinase n=1 Tax=Flavobacterium sp. TaxID=239 RepID=UPI0037539C88
MKTNTTNNSYILDEKLSFYEKILNNIPDLILQLTISPENDIYFSYLNKTIVSLFEVNKFELRDKSINIISKRIHNDDKENFFNSLFNSKKTLENWSCEFRVVLIDKKIQWYKVDANVENDSVGNTLFYCSLTNISKIKSREFKVQESETRYQFALEASKKGIWDYNIETGEVYFSKESLEILQFNESDQINTNTKWDERIHPEDLENYLDHIQNHKDDKSQYFENTKRVLAKDGSYKWILSIGKIIQRDLNGYPLRIIGTHSDVTAEKLKEKQLLGNLDIISEQNNRLLNFAHIVSHNLRSHTGNFEMLLNLIETEKDDETQEECFRHLKTTSNSLSDTIEHLKTLVDINSTPIHVKEYLRLNDYLNKTLEILSAEIKKNKVIIENNISNIEGVNFNPAYLESILLNFTTNAIKYSHPDRIPKIIYTFEKNENKSSLVIKDNGLGINLDKHGEKLFGMYKTFHKNEDARGIGLFITKNQIESMGGTIEVESKVNVGTTFKINFNEEI